MSFIKTNSYLLFLCFILNATSALAATSNHSKLLSVNVADYMVSGQRYSVSVGYKNVGSTVWSTKKKYRLAWTKPGQEKIWGVINTKGSLDASVAPGESVMIKFELVAPAAIRSAKLSLKLQGSDGKTFGEVAESRLIQIERSGKQARIVMQLVPDKVTAGQSFKAAFRVENIGKSVWSREVGYRLAALNLGVWGMDYIELDSSAHVAPGEIASFEAQFTAPEKPGVYAFQWQMQRHKAFFGDVSTPVNVAVTGNANLLYNSEFVYQKVAQTMLLGDIHEVVVQFKNSSNLVWHAADISLVTTNVDGLIWAVENVNVASSVTNTVAPGEFATFRFNVQAPLDAGQYPFQWQMSHRRNGLFGVPSERLMIGVK